MSQHTSYSAEPVVNGATSARSHHLLALSASTPAALHEAATCLAEHLKRHPELNIADVVYTLHTTRIPHEYRRFVVCQDHSSAIKALETPDARHVSGINNSTLNRRVAFLLPGLGEQYVELARALYRDEPDFRETVEQCCHFLRLHLDLDLRAIFISAAPSTGEELPAPSSSALDFRAFVRRSGHDVASPFAQPTLAHPATFVLEYALAGLLKQWGICPSAMLGYSLGEYVAACLAGVLSLEDALVLVATRARLLQNAPRGAMLAVNLAEKDVYAYLSDRVSLAAVSSPISCVLAGSEEAVDRLKRHLVSQDIVCQPVTATHAFHTPMLNPLRNAVTEVTQHMKLSPPQIPYISNVTGTWITTGEATDAGYWASHMCQAVRFADGVKRLLEDAECFVLEVGPGRSLSSFVKQHPSCGMKRMPLVQASLPAAHERQSCQSFLLQTLGKLWQAGVAIDWTGFYVREQRQCVSLPV